MLDYSWVKTDKTDPGYVAYTGRILNEYDAANLNRATDRIVRFLANHREIKSGSLAHREIETLLNQRHRLFQTIALN